MSWTRAAKKGFKGTVPSSRFKQSVGTSIASTTLHLEESSQVADKTRAPGAFLFFFMDDVYFNSTYSSGSNFRTDEISEWFRDDGSVTNLVPDDDPYEEDVPDTEGMSLLLSADQKTFFADLLDDADDIFDFEGNNGDDGTTLINSDGWIVTAASPSGTMARNDNGYADVISDNPNHGSGFHLPFTTEEGEDYQCGFDLITGTYTVESFGVGIFCIGANNTYGPGDGLVAIKFNDPGEFTSNVFTATGTTSYVHFRISRGGDNVQIDNFWINKVTTS